ncbi:MAG: hypothetical protein KUG76_08345 [Gammaproteobacteria bacterium]|nr:hypothetical protein [Gammaproteobacteria bacterium]
MLKKAVSLVLILFAPLSIADDCTSKLDSYASGIELAVEKEQFVSQDRRDWANSESKRIEKLREQMSDCEVVRRVSVFIQSEQAIKAANDKVNALRNPSKQEKDAVKKPPPLYTRRY